MYPRYARRGIFAPFPLTFPQPRLVLFTLLFSRVLQVLQFCTVRPSVLRFEHVFPPLQSCIFLFEILAPHVDCSFRCPVKFILLRSLRVLKEFAYQPVPDVLLLLGCALIYAAAIQSSLE